MNVVSAILSVMEVSKKALEFAQTKEKQAIMERYISQLEKSQDILIKKVLQQEKTINILKGEANGK